MKSVFPSFIFIITIFTSCFTDIREIPADAIYVNTNNTVIHITDSLAKNNQTDSLNIEIEKTYIFEFHKGEYMYAYGDLLKVNNDELLVVSARSMTLDDFGKSHIVISSSFDDGNTWTEPKEISIDIPKKHLIISHPTLLKINEAGHIMLFFLVKYDIKSIDIMYKESFDNGKTWGEHKIVFGENQGYQILNNNRVIFENGRIIIPLSIPSNEKGFLINYEDFSVFYYYSDDLGKTWVKSPRLTSFFALLEPGIVQINNNEYLMYIRTDLGKILFARTHNKGLNWTFEPSNIKSPSSPQKIIKVPDSNDLIMVWNYTDDNFRAHVGNRNPLSLAVSKDKGYTWNYLVDIERFDSDSDKVKYNYSYPSISIYDSTIYITYFEIYRGSSLKLARIKNLKL
jgi:sialidase-1